MSGTPHLGGWSDLLGLSLDETLRRDEDYVECMNKRLKRLREQGQSIQGNLKESVDRCIKMTEKTHGIAEELNEEIKKIDRLYPKSAIDRLKWVKSLVERTTAEKGGAIDNQSPDSDRIDRFVETTRFKAMEFLEFVISSDDMQASGKTIGQGLDAWLQSEFEHDRQSIKYQVIIYLTFLNSYDAMLGPFLPLIHLASLYRGLLYVGVMDTTGSALERKLLNDSIRKAIHNLFISKIPYLDKILDGLNILDASLTNNPSLDAIKQVNFVMQYYDTYENVINLWSQAAESLLETIRGMRESVLENNS